MRNIAVMLPCDHTQLAVNFVIRQPVNHTTAGILQHLGIVNIVLFIKSGTQLQQAKDILASVSLVGKSCSYFAAGRHTV